MTTVLLDSEYSDELLHMNEDPLFEYGSPFVMEDLYPNQMKINNEETSLESCRASDCSSEEEDYDFKMLQPHAPPPSPQDTSMLDLLFAKKLSSSLEACLVQQQQQEPTNNRGDQLGHAQSLDKLLRRTLNQPQGRGICKRNLKRSYTFQSTLPWQHHHQQQQPVRVRNHSIADQAEKLKKALQKHLMDEETSVMINDLKDMGL